MTSIPRRGPTPPAAVAAVAAVITDQWQRNPAHLAEHIVQELEAQGWVIAPTRAAATAAQRAA